MNAITETWKVLFRKMTPTEMAARELAEAELRLLEAQSAVEYANSVVAYNNQRIKRLKQFITQQNEVPDLRNKTHESA
jgi:hypothetical protein